MSLKFISESSITVNTPVTIGSLFTIETYVKVSNPVAGNNICLFSTAPVNGTYIQCFLEVDTSTSRNMRIYMRSYSNGAGLTVTKYTNYDIIKDTWVHICVVFGFNEIRLYTNGTLKLTTTTQNLIPPINSTAFLILPPLYHTFPLSINNTVDIYNFAVYNGLKYPIVSSITITEAVPSDLTNYLLVLNGIRIPGEFINGQTLGTWAPSVTKNNITYSDFNGKTYSTVCFVAGTRVLTDHGYIPIECIDYNTHEIYGKKIIAVTKTVTPETHLACVSKNALSPGVPDRDTLMTLNHKIKFNGVLTEVYQFVNLLPGISLVKYNQEPLFNVLLENHDVMIVNNMIVETLDPENLLAKMFIKMKELSLADRETLINMYNDYIKEKFQDSVKMLKTFNNQLTI